MAGRPPFPSASVSIVSTLLIFDYGRYRYRTLRYCMTSLHTIKMDTIKYTLSVSRIVSRYLVMLYQRSELDVDNDAHDDDDSHDDDDERCKQ